MTTIAYKEGMIAADTGMTIGETRMGYSNKIIRNSIGDLAAAAGYSTFCHKFRSWFLFGENGEAPKAQRDDDIIDRAVIVRYNNVEGTLSAYNVRFLVFEEGGTYEVEAPYFAMGSGKEFALGAMFAGADAHSAVLAAIQHDTATFGPITVMRHDKE